MAKFTPEELGRRLAFDNQVAMPMCYDLMDLSAHRKAEDARANKNPILDPVEASEAKHYRVEYHIKTLVGRDKYHELTIVHIDLLANGNYPYSDPSCWVISKPIPWSPHFKDGSPICLGEIWREAKGNMLLGHLLDHIARLLNFDEEARGGGYVGWNGQAARFWEKELNEQPITPGLIYPTVPTDRTHGVKHTMTTPGLFRAGGQMRPDPSSGPGTLFRPK